MSKLFGTDGVRGLANGLITAELSLQLAQAAAVVLGHGAVEGGRRPTAVIARDPRISGEFIAAAVEAGLASSGVDVYDAGVLPTPAAAFLVADLDADFGVMISASHNAAPDNGIKFLARGGKKLSDALEDARPAATAADRNSPEMRGSRASTATGRFPAARRASALRPCPSTTAVAWARPRARSAVRSAFARPRTPSVPNS